VPLTVCASAFAEEERVTPSGQGISETRGESMSLASLQDRLRGTMAISVAGKMGLKADIDSLMGKFRVAHGSGREVRSLGQPYDSPWRRFARAGLNAAGSRASGPGDRQLLPLRRISGRRFFPLHSPVMVHALAREPHCQSAGS